MGHRKLWNGQQGRYFSKTLTKTKDSGTPENQPSSPFNKPATLSRFSFLEKKLEQNPGFARKYREAIYDYVNKGHTVKLSEQKSKNVTTITNYVPHYGNVNINQPGKV